MKAPKIRLIAPITVPKIPKMSSAFIVSGVETEFDDESRVEMLAVIVELYTGDGGGCISG